MVSHQGFSAMDTMGYDKTPAVQCLFLNKTNSKADGTAQKGTLNAQYSG